MKRILSLILFVAAPATAGEVFAGLSAHGYDLGFVSGSYEHGVDLVAGVRSAPVAHLGASEVRLHALGSVDLSGGVDFAAVGASLRVPLGSIFYVQPGLGVAIQDGSDAHYQVRPDRLYLGSRVLFEPELTVGARLTPKLAAEVAYIHLSHAQLASKQNPGLDTLGVRLVYRFGR